MSEPTTAMVTLRNVVYEFTSHGLSFIISGPSVTTKRPDGSEQEFIFDDDFTDEEIMENIFAQLRPSSPSSLKIQRMPSKTVTYCIKGPERRRRKLIPWH